MAKKSKKKEEPKEEKPLVIMAAKLRDDYCDYTFEIKSGVGVGDKHNVTGKGIVLEDMINAFQRLNVHLAAIDDVFEHNSLEIDNIDKFHNHELTALFHVTGIKIKGSDENESVILVGSKHVNSGGGRIEMETPKVLLAEYSAYKWYNELRDAVEVVRTEVELYKGGKCTVPEKEETDTKQLRITDEQDIDFELSSVK